MGETTEIIYQDDRELVDEDYILDIGDRDKLGKILVLSQIGILSVIVIMNNLQSITWMTYLILFLIMAISFISMVLTPILWNKACKTLNKALCWEFNIVTHIQRDEVRPGIDLNSARVWYEQDSRIQNRAEPKSKIKNLGYYLRIPILTLMGLRLKVQNKHFLEQKIEEDRIMSKKFVLHILNASFTCLGITFALFCLLNMIFQLPFQLDLFIILERSWLVLLSYLICSILVMTFLSPITWTIRDASIRYIDVEDNWLINDLGKRMRSSIIGENIFGLGGLLLTISLAGNYSQIEVEGFNLLMYLFYYLDLFLNVGLIFLFIFSFVFVTVLEYYIRYHEVNVNNLRKSLGSLIPFGSTGIFKL